MVDYTNCVVKAQKVQTVKLTLYKCEFTRPMRNKIKLQTIIDCKSLYCVKKCKMLIKF